ncbi:MAG: hypothetical protein P1S60_03445, partial [Anaerolineae bacterium]|nr:hypothetical protein [Anaerolineae bacterium]
MRVSGWKKSLNAAFLVLTTIISTACLGAKYQSIQGWVYWDVNQNGIRDDADTPLQDVTVHFVPSESQISEG